jgi:hypothetical protein
VLSLRQSGNCLFPKDKTFWWGKIGNWALEDGGRVIVFWLPDHKEIYRLITGGKLPGVLMEGKAGKKEILGPLLPKHYQVLRDHEQEIFFRENNPLVLVRLAKQ